MPALAPSARRRNSLQPARGPLRHLKIIKIMTHVNMRVTRAFRDRGVCRTLKAGQCILAINGRETIVRLWDWRGSYTMYCPDGQVFDVDTIHEWMAAGIGVKLDGLKRDSLEREDARDDLDAEAVA